MKKADALVKNAIKRNGKRFKRWIEETPDNVLPINEIRKITSKISYSMSKNYIFEKESE